MASPSKYSSGKPHLSRRSVLRCGGASLVSLSLGCGESSDRQPSESAPRRDVPLRLLWCGQESEVEVLKVAWAAVDPLPLDVTLIDLGRESGLKDWGRRGGGQMGGGQTGDGQTGGGQTGNEGSEGAGEPMRRLIELGSKSDVIVYPVAAAGELHQGQCLTPISESLLNGETGGGQPLLTAARNGMAGYAGRPMSVPLGARQPALVLADAGDAFETWEEYDQWVATVDGAAAEPIAKGWAGMMFLWRAVATIDSGWLFSRQEMEPQIAEPTYVDALSLMKKTVARYQGPSASPEEIWSLLQAGKLRGGVTFAANDETGDADLQILNAPQGTLGRVLADPFSPVASVGANCRQTASSKRFIAWLSGGEGSDSVRRQVAGMTAMRRTVKGGEVASQTGRQRYDAWLQERLSVPNTAATLQVLAATEYYGALDREVNRCLSGDVEPAAALTAVSEQWSAITARVGVKKQRRAWRQSQGMTA